jgi:hypothetical protein
LTISRDVYHKSLRSLTPEEEIEIWDYVALALMEAAELKKKLKEGA